MSEAQERFRADLHAVFSTEPGLRALRGLIDRSAVLMAEAPTTETHHAYLAGRRSLIAEICGLLDVALEPSVPEFRSRKHQHEALP